MGIKRGALFKAFLATRNAFSGSDGLGPHDLDQRVFRAIWNEIAAIGRSSEALRCWRAPAARQSGNPGPTGKPADRTALRSGGNANPNSASARANSDSDKPGWTWIPELLRWVIRFSAKEEYERRPFLTGRDGLVFEGVVGPAAARADRRRRPATWAGFRPVILRSTSTIECGVVVSPSEVENRKSVSGYAFWERRK